MFYYIGISQYNGNRLTFIIPQIKSIIFDIKLRRGRDRMVVGFTTTYTISPYSHWCCEFESRSGRGVKFVSDLRQVGGFLQVLLHQ